MPIHPDLESHSVPKTPIIDFSKRKQKSEKVKRERLILKEKTGLKMALTRSARSKVQKNLEHKQNEDKSGEEEKEEEMSSAKPCPLPKTVKDIGNNSNESHLNTRTAVLLLVIIFACAAAALALVYYSFPHLDS